MDGNGLCAARRSARPRPAVDRVARRRIAMRHGRRRNEVGCEELAQLATRVVVDTDARARLARANRPPSTVSNGWADFGAREKVRRPDRRETERPDATS